MLVPMRYGMLPLGLGAVASSVSDGLAALAQLSVPALVRKALEIDHISVIELSMDIVHIVPGVLGSRHIQELCDLRDEMGHSYTVHLPIWSVELSSPNDAVRAASVKTVVDAIRHVGPLEPEAYVLHLTGSLASALLRMGLPESATPVVLTLVNRYSAQSLEEILVQSEIDPRLLAVENVSFPFAATRMVVDEFDTGICLDTGHILAKSSGDEPLLEFYRANRDRIVEIHLHDGYVSECGGVLVPKDHLPLGDGSLPIRAFFLRLVADRFSGPLVFELGESAVRKSLHRLVTEIPSALA